MQTVLNQTPSRLLKGSLAFLLGGFEDGLTGLSVESTSGGELEIYNALGSRIITPDDGTPIKIFTQSALKK